MNISTDNNRKIGKTLAVGFPLATLLVMALSADPAGAAVTSAKAFSWGNNSYSQLGNGTYGPATATNTPGAVSNLSDVRSVKDGCSHSLARFGDGTVWAWGYNGLGQLGNGTSGAGTDSDVPVAVKNLTGVTNMDEEATNSRWRSPSRGDGPSTERSSRVTA